MAPIPFIGRLNPAEYLALVGSFFLVGAEAIIRILTLALPSSIISLCYRASRRLFNRLTSPAAKNAAIKQKDVSSSIRDASDFVDICALYGYYAEEHIVQTGDGYLLGLHRLAWRRGEEELKVNHGRNSLKKNVVYMHHGLLMNSEVWVCLTDEQRCLPFKLVEAGYDVWVNVFIALAPAMSPAGLSNGIVDALTKASPQVLFLLFGRRSILSSATMWQSILYPPIFVRLIDMGLSFLFGWHARNISTSQKLAAYPHLYSFTSTKSVVHWFQIIRTKSFQMYDDDVQQVVPFGSVSKYTKVAKFPTRNIKTPIVLVYGGSDSLVDIDVMMKELPAHTIATEIPHYEHLDFLWARDVESLVFPHVFDALNSFVDAEHSKEEYDRYRSARHASLGARATRPALLNKAYASEDESGQTYADAASVEPGEDADALSTARDVLHSDPYLPSPGARKRVKIQQDYESSSAGSSPIAPPHVKTAVDEGNVYKNGNLTSKLKHSRRGSSGGSSLNFGGDGSRGISLGAGRPVSSVVTGETVVKITSSDEGSIGRKKGRAGGR
ncbi:putative lipase [Lachnellula occidentalis]|uniref:Putative lipase n=1 Tax=Lachnellula occidentalis TaxID=215460 RepID=A0A8H8RUD2_9HELO|nr:putative lipase [Lachnellula occidentalis]